jgi:protein translocase SEC61 complex gamma subunit
MLRSMGAIFKLAKKSDRTEFMLYLKLVALGVAVVGVIGFFIKFISAAFPAVFG